MEELSRLLVVLNIASAMLIVAYMVHTEKRILGNFAHGRPLAACEKDAAILPPDIIEGIYGGLCVTAVAAVPPRSLAALRLACVLLFFSLLRRHIRKKDTENRYGGELKKMAAACHVGWAAVLLLLWFVFVG